MTAPENFVSRWARLKRGSVITPNTEPAVGRSHAEAVASASAETPSAPQRDEVIDQPFDPASLPSIETITVDTDIRGFLQSRVPAALARAALRQAWASDPAIRDFIGIAENQWDFNDAAAMPGFGPMRETDNVLALLTRALGERDKLADIIPEIQAPVENALPAMADRESASPDESVLQTSERSPLADESCKFPDDSNGSAAARNDRGAEEGDAPRSYRVHGSALPR